VSVAILSNVVVSYLTLNRLPLPAVLPVSSSRRHSSKSSVA